MPSKSFDYVTTRYTPIDGKSLVPSVITHNGFFRSEEKFHELFKVNPLRIAKLFAKPSLPLSVNALGFKKLFHG